MGHLLFIDLAGIEALAQVAGEHGGDLAQITHFLQLFQLIQIIRKGQAVFPQLLLQLFGLLLVILLLRLLNEGKHIAHTQNTGGHTLRVKQLDHVQLFAGAHELDGLARGRPDGQGRAASCVAVQLGQQHPVDAQGLVEGGGGVHGVLAGHGIHHQEDLMGMDVFLDPLQLVHQLLVDMQAAGSIQEHGVVSVVGGVFQRLPGDFHRVALAHFKNGYIQLLAHHLQLLDGGGAVHIAGHQQGPLAVLAAHEARQLRAVGGFTGTLQAHHHHNGGALGRGGDAGIAAAHKLGKLLVHDLHDLLGGGQALQHVAAHAALSDLGNEILDHLVADIRLQQRKAHLTQARLDIGLRQTALAPQALKSFI